MYKVESAIRTAPFILRMLILFSWLLTFFMFIFNPLIHGSGKDETVFQLIFISSTLLAVYLSYLYFRLPKVPITLMVLDKNKLSFRTMRNPAFGVGQDFQEKFLIDKDDVLYIYPYIQYLHQVGSFFCVTFYCREAGVFPAYYEAEYKDELIKLLDGLLTTNKKIKLINDRGFALANFPAMEDRMIQEIPDDYRPDGSNRRILYPEKYSEQEWQTLLMCPFLVFRAVANADGTIDKWESRTMVTMLKSSAEQRSFLVADLLSDALENFDALLDEVLDDDFERLEEVLGGAASLVDREGDDTDKCDFRVMLIQFAHSVAESSGLGKQRVSNEENRVLKTIEYVLKMDV